MTPDLAEAVYDYARDMITECGSPPTRSEIADRFSIRPALARAIVERLIREGRLLRTDDRERNLALPIASDVDLTRLPTGALQRELDRRGRPWHRPTRLYADRTRPCAADGCEERVRRGQLFCRDHWFALPEGLRRELIITFRDGQHAAYQDAWRRAVLHLEGIGA